MTYYKDNKETEKKRNALNYYKDREKKIEKAKEWADNNKEKVRAYKRKWKRENREKNKVQQQTMRKYGPITGNCTLCDNKATVRHHNTTPYHSDKWVEVCEQCHNKIHRKW